MSITSAEMIPQNTGFSKPQLFSVISIGKFSVTFNCYNTSWMSRLHEQPGKVYFPLERYPAKLFAHKSDLVVSILHHPFNWQNCMNLRAFQAHIEKTSDILLTGHEHMASKSVKSDLEGNFTGYIEGAVLQDHDDDTDSGFNLVLIDLERKKRRILNYEWNGEIYSSTDDSKEWLSYKRGKDLDKRDFVINENFEKDLNDLGAAFTHPNRSEIVLKDFFIYPDLKDKTINEGTRVSTVNSSVLREIGEGENRILLLGETNSGKTSVCKILYQCYYNDHYVPIYVEGHLVKSTSIKTFNALVSKCYTKQYSSDTLERFDQLDNRKKVLIIDDFDSTKLAAKFRFALLNTIGEYYPNILITADPLFGIEEILRKGQETDKEDRKELILEGYRKYEILEFGHLLRTKLIEKWNALGVKESIEEYELLRKNDDAKRIIDTIIGSNFVPSYPIFLLTILQGIEAGTPHDLRESSYGHYYQILITYALSKINRENDVIDAYYNYIAELANYLFKSRIREISKDTFSEFHQWFCDEYRVSGSFNTLINLDRLINDLSNASIIVGDNAAYRFRYKYVYYYFVAKYMSDNITRDDIKQRISEMCKRLYVEEFANIIMFLTYHSKNPIVLEEILANAKSLFPDIEPVRLEEDILNVNNLLDEIPKLVLENRDVRENRERALKNRDEAELSEKQDENGDNDKEYDLQEEVKADVISELNSAFKTIEILGQILRNYYGSLKGTIRADLGEEAYFLGLRSWNSLFSFIEENTDYFVSMIELFIEKHGLVEKHRIQNAARKWLFGFCSMVSYTCIKNISGSIGHEKLSETFKDILRNNDFTSVRLIDMSTKLDFFKDFPYADVKTLHRELSKSALPDTLLKLMVIRHLYMFPTTSKNRKNRQELCATLGISQKAIQIRSTQEKRK